MFIQLTRGYLAIVDKEDYKDLMRFKWFANPRHPYTTYASRTDISAKGKKTIRMHRQILDAKPGMDVDHINGNGLDNRRENLRVITHRENMQNIVRRHGTSQFPGVSWSTYEKRWRSCIDIGGKTIHLGYFDDEIEASLVYRSACDQITVGILP